MRKNAFLTFLVAALFYSRASFAADYATDITSVGDAQAQALEQARQLLGQTEKPDARQALQKAIQDMERAELVLADAKKSPEKLRAAVAAEQSAYQGLLKIIPHEFQVSNSRGRGRSGGRAGQPRSGQIDQLELTSEDNRYETERQATAAPTRATARATGDRGPLEAIGATAAGLERPARGVANRPGRSAHRAGTARTFSASSSA